jgi:predicted ATPase
MSSPVPTPNAEADQTPTSLRLLSRPRSTYKVASLAPLIGRGRELAHLLDLLAQDQARLVTLTGTGGIGKTRLALEAASRLNDTFDDGVVIVTLAPIRDPELAVSTIAQAVGVRDMPDRSTLERIQIGLADMSMLLVLDNLEQVPGLAQPIAEILASCSGVKVLATSRGALHVPGERELPLSPLPVLPVSESVDPDEAAALPSVRLFVERAAAVRPGFALTEQNGGTVTAICSRLDGLPLAIELAAARSRILPPAAILARLEKRLPFLTSGAPGLPERQQTLRNTIAWSYELLSKDEQRLFRRLAVFSGGFTLDAAEAICADVEPIITNPLDGLAGLADKGMIAIPDDSNEGEAEPRFRMLETIREFALEQLEAGGEAEAARYGHARRVLAETERAETIYLRGDNTPWLTRIVAEQENIRAALAWFIERQDADCALKLSAASIWLWFVRGQFREGRSWIDQVLAAPWAAVCSVARCRALYAAGMLAH